MNVPGAQVFQAAQLAAFRPEANVPAAQAAQLRSVLAEGAELAYVPGAQSRQTEQA